MTQQELQSKWQQIQKNISEKVISEDGVIEIVLNGFVEINNLKINTNIITSHIEEQLKICINIGIKNVSNKAQNMFIQFQKQNHIR